jgi:hypothetical protein
VKLILVTVSVFIATVIGVAGFGCQQKTTVEVKPYKQNQMEGGCVYQESQGKVIRTCG